MHMCILTHIDQEGRHRFLINVWLLTISAVVCQTEPSTSKEEKPSFFSFSAYDVRDCLFDSYPVSDHQISTDSKPDACSDLSTSSHSPDIHWGSERIRYGRSPGYMLFKAFQQKVRVWEDEVGKEWMQNIPVDCVIEPEPVETSYQYETPSISLLQSSDTK